MLTTWTPPLEPDEVSPPQAPVAPPEPKVLKPITSSAGLGVQNIAPVPCKPPNRIDAFRETQGDLAAKATKVADMALDKMQGFIEKGVNLGEGVFADVSPSAVVAIYKEARETIATPIKTAQDDRAPRTPVSINTNNPEVIKAIIAALHDHREEQRLLDSTTVEHSEEGVAA